MNEKATAFFEELKQKKVAVIGLGVSHDDLISLLCKKGIGVTLLDGKEDIGERRIELAALGVNLCLGKGYLDHLSDFDVVFRAPGVYFLKDELTKARESGVVITSEMEVFFELCPCKIYALSGSDGKTTTSTIISEFLKASGKTVHLGGNIGRALLPIIEQIKPTDVCVVELSSFQLISMRQSPDVAVITNISPNHLDVHHDMAEYVEAKRNLIRHQNAFSTTVLNRDNAPCYELKNEVRGRLRCFSRQKMPQNGAFLDGEGMLCYVKNGKVQKLFNKSLIKIPGIHNVENYLAAIAAAGDEASPADMQRVAKEFSGVEHRIEFVRELNGVRYYNDSIASSPTRTIAGLYSFDQRLIVIAGGYDKKIPYEPLGPALASRAKLVILLGATAKKIEAALRGCSEFNEHNTAILHAESLEQAVELAAKNAKAGDAVTLSPASASFDLYKNFEERGKHFKSIVNSL